MSSFLSEKNLQIDCQRVLAGLQLDDAPAGGALVVFYQGECLVSASVGQALENQSWTVDTLSLNFSAGKGILATLVHILVSKGILAYDKPIADSWLEFAQQGKGDITLRQVLCHQANLFDITAVTDCANDMLNWQLMLEKVANMPVSKPTLNSQNLPEGQGYVSAYSALVYGWVLGGLIEKVTGQDLQSVLDECLTQPLGIEGCVFFGVPDDKLSSVAKPVRCFNRQKVDEKVSSSKRHKPILKPDSENTLAFYRSLSMAGCWQEKLAERALNTQNINGLYFNQKALNLVNYKRALMPNTNKGSQGQKGQATFDYYDDVSLQECMPAVNGVASASALATIYAMLANQGCWQGQRLIDLDTFYTLSQVQSSGFDAVMPANMQWRLGYHRVFNICSDAGESFGHMGYNGATAWCNPKHQLAFAFIHNFDTTMLNDVRQFVLGEMVFDWLGRGNGFKK